MTRKLIKIILIAYCSTISSCGCHHKGNGTCTAHQSIAQKSKTVIKRIIQNDKQYGK
ncbi:hypothetical protein LL912_04885 [Niabella sp. CC-SYL272]|uniref:hypothetical protein n=1 Tax=Niabella agricola TaxID=2891571 RepID=UPI001F345EF4|nr:hypothetical protein [Niabella agricola]MCF3108104.1 hypothetical protein [Niabella agricola]